MFTWCRMHLTTAETRRSPLPSYTSHSGVLFKAVLLGGATNQPSSFPPPPSSSGVLVKAVLLGGATAMAGNVQLIDPSSNQWQNLPLEEPPSFRQGFGRLDLANSLPLLSSPLGWNMQASGAEGGIGTGGGGMQESGRGSTGINEHLA